MGISEEILIVAECNVNLRIKLEMLPILRVLIVAECNVNESVNDRFTNDYEVLIVVNCNINILQNVLLIKSLRYFNYRIILKLIILLEI